jgi:hypothetical protein
MIDKLDLKLFTDLFPKVKIFYDEDWDTEHKSPMYIPSGKPKRTHMIDAVLVPRFTTSIAACFTYLIPEMNRRGFTVYIRQERNNNWNCMFADSGATYDATDSQLTMAICLAADKAIKSMEER